MTSPATASHLAPLVRPSTDAIALAEALARRPDARAASPADPTNGWLALNRRTAAGIVFVSAEATT